MQFVWVVVDGGSSDGTRAYLAGQERVEKFISEPDGGIYDAMRKGLCLVETEYVLFLNAGDEFAGPSALIDACSILSSHDVYFFDTRIVSGDTSWLRKARALAAARYSVPAVQQSTIYRAEALRKIGWPDGYKVCGDYFLAAQFLARNSSSASYHITLSDFHVGGVSTNSFYLLCVEAWNIQKIVLSISLWRRCIDFVRRWITGLLVFLAHRFG